MKLKRKEFEEVVIIAIKGLPRFFRKKMNNVDVVIENQPSRDLLSSLGIHSPYDLLGLYQGVPIDRRGFYYGNVLPDKITLFQRSIEALCKTRREIEEKVREVIIHEVGHYFGLDEERIKKLEANEGEN